MNFLRPHIPIGWYERHKPAQDRGRLSVTGPKTMPLGRAELKPFGSTWGRCGGGGTGTEDILQREGRHRRRGIIDTKTYNWTIHFMIDMFSVVFSLSICAKADEAQRLKLRASINPHKTNWPGKQCRLQAPPKTECAESSRSRQPSFVPQTVAVMQSQARPPSTAEDQVKKQVP